MRTSRQIRKTKEEKEIGNCLEQCKLCRVSSTFSTCRSYVLLLLQSKAASFFLLFSFLPIRIYKTNKAETRLKQTEDGDGKDINSYTDTSFITFSSYSQVNKKICGFLSGLRLPSHNQKKKKARTLPEWDWLHYVILVKISVYWEISFAQVYFYFTHANSISTPSAPFYSGCEHCLRILE